MLKSMEQSSERRYPKPELLPEAGVRGSLLQELLQAHPLGSSTLLPTWEGPVVGLSPMRCSATEGLQGALELFHFPYSGPRGYRLKRWLCLPRLCDRAALTGKSGGVLWSPIGEPQFIHVSSWLFQVQPLVLPTPPPDADLRGFPHSLPGDASKGVSLLPLRGKAGRDCSFWLSGLQQG